MSTSHSQLELLNFDHANNQVLQETLLSTTDIENLQPAEKI